MNNLDLSSIDENPHLLDILIQCEDVFDSLDVYVYKNWINGEVVEGPKIRKFWVTFSLMYAYEDMPDPRAAMRLVKHGIYVKYHKEQVEHLQGDNEDYCWIIDIQIPRKLIRDMQHGDLDLYNHEVDTGDIKQAKDDGIDSESAYSQDNI
jgi:hypothetical protein